MKLTMKLTNEQVYYAGEGIQRLGSIKFPIKTSLQIATLEAKLAKTIKPIAAERKAIIRKYEAKKEKGDDGNLKPLPPDLQQLMENEIDAMMDKESDIDIKPDDPIRLPEKISDTCDKCRHNMDKVFTIEPNTLALLVPFIDLGTG